MSKLKYKSQRLAAQTPQPAQSGAIVRRIAALLLACSLPNTSTRAASWETFTEPIRSINVAVSQSGRISEISISRGERVKRGDLIIQLDASVLEASRKVAQAKADNKARLEALQIELAAKEQRLANIAQIYKDGAGSVEEVNRAQVDADVARRNLDAANEEVVLNKLQLGEITARIEERRIRSPIDGIVTDIVRETGEYVSTAEPQVATVVQLERLRATFYVPTSIAIRFRAGEFVTVNFPETNQTASATIEFVSPVTEADSGLVRLDALIANRAEKFRSGLRCILEPERPAIRTTKTAASVSVESAAKRTSRPINSPRRH